MNEKQRRRERQWRERAPCLSAPPQARTWAMLLKSAFNAWVPSFPLISLLLSLKKNKAEAALKMCATGGQKGSL